jgi:DNA-binding response OmpR family regulator
MNKKVLIVEDEKSLRQALAKKLGREGFSTIEAENGREGLALALGEHPDLILLDIVMPVMDGMTLLRRLQDDEWGKSAKVVLLTNLSDNEFIAQALVIGAYEYLVKSNWTMDDIAHKVKEKTGMLEK